MGLGWGCGVFLSPLPMGLGWGCGSFFSPNVHTRFLALADSVWVDGVTPEAAGGLADRRVAQVGARFPLQLKVQ